MVQLNTATPTEAAPITMDAAQSVVRGAVKSAVTRANTGRVRLALAGGDEAKVSVFAEVRDGREPRGLPLHGEHALGRLGQELDRERARLVMVFTIAGTVNGVTYDGVTIWIQGDRASLPTLFAGTDAARKVFYGIAERVQELTWRHAPLLLDAAWRDHLRGLAARVGEREAYLAAIQAKITEALA